MNGHNITNESLALSMVLVLIAILVSYREKLALEKILSGYLPGDRAADNRRLCAEIYL